MRSPNSWTATSRSGTNRTPNNAAGASPDSGRRMASIFTPQQHRLLSLAPAHANVIPALNNAALYLGTAGGAMLGGVALHVLPVTQLSWVGASFALLALLLLLLSFRASAISPGGQDALISVPQEDTRAIPPRAC